MNQALYAHMNNKRKQKQKQKTKQNKKKTCSWRDWLCGNGS
jgi:hypothetical protein